MNKDVFAIFAGDETEAFIGIIKFNGTCRHDRLTFSLSPSQTPIGAHMGRPRLAQAGECRLTRGSGTSRMVGDGCIAVG